MSGHTAGAQQLSDQQLNAAVPMPDTTPPAPPTAKDIPGAVDTQPAPVKADAAPAPSPDAAKAAAAPASVQTAEPVKPASDPVADALREIVGSKHADHLIVRKAERAGVETYYKTHDFKPIWIADGALTPRAKAAIDTLSHADELGLEPADYLVPSLKADMSPQAQAEAELKISAAVLNYARQAQVGRISFTRVDADIAFKQEAPDPEKVLEKLAVANDAGKALDGYNPPQPEFSRCARRWPNSSTAGPCRTCKRSRPSTSMCPRARCSARA